MRTHGHRKGNITLWGLLDYSGDSEPIKTADLLEMVVIDMRKDEQGCWYVLVVHPKLLEALRREKKMT